MQFPFLYELKTNTSHTAYKNLKYLVLIQILMKGMFSKSFINLTQTRLFDHVKIIIRVSQLNVKIRI